MLLIIMEPTGWDSSEYREFQEEDSDTDTDDEQDVFVRQKTILKKEYKRIVEEEPFLPE